MRKSALLLAVVFAASLPSVADAAKAKRAKAKPAAEEVDPNAAGKLVLTEGLPGLLMPTVAKPLWFHYQDEQKKTADKKGKRRAAQ